MIKTGDLVTVSLDLSSTPANTYAVARKLDGESLLSHPLCPDMFVLKKDDELNLVAANLKNDDERCLQYAQKFSKYLDHDDSAILSSLCMYFVVHHRLTKKQLKLLSGFIGEIARVYCNNDLEIAIRLVNENHALLNEYNRNWFLNFEDVFKGLEKRVNAGKRVAIFNICGFLLAQLEGISSRR